jgi:hypothetical protein
MSWSSLNLNWRQKTQVAMEADRSAYIREARQRLKERSFWLDQPREGWTRRCEAVAALMSAGPGGGYVPRLDCNFPTEYGRKRFLAKVGE